MDLLLRLKWAVHMAVEIAGGGGGGVTPPTGMGLWLIKFEYATSTTYLAIHLIFKFVTSNLVQSTNRLYLSLGSLERDNIFSE